MGSQISREVVEERSGTGSSSWNSPDEILIQLERVVSSPHFRNSKRYPALLRYLVEQTLLGRVDSLKERTLGIEVFARPADYDTNADPVVRITAGEVRKRIAQYYQSPDHEHELRLELPLGSYVPHFLPPHEAVQSATAHAIERAEVVASTPRISDPVPVREQVMLDPATPLETRPEVTPTARAGAPLPFGRSLLRSRLVGAVLLLLVVAMLAGAAVLANSLLTSRKEDAGISFFWGPLLHSKEVAMIVLGVHSFDVNGKDLSPSSYAQLPHGQQTVLSSMIRSNMVPVSDVVSYSEIISLITRRSLPFRTQSAAETTIEEFRRGPLILIGGFDNMWTMRLTSSLRFRLVARSESVHEIVDSEHPTSRWEFDNAQSALSNSRDYAVVARFFDPQIEQHVLVVAGIGQSGTAAAAEFITTPRTLQAWVEATPAERQDNVEIVLATDIIEGKHGPPHVVAGYRW